MASPASSKSSDTRAAVDEASSPRSGHALSIRSRLPSRSRSVARAACSSAASRQRSVDATPAVLLRLPAPPRRTAGPAGGAPARGLSAPLGGGPPAGAETRGGGLGGPRRGPQPPAAPPPR